jgi:hypothetical protein
MIYAVLSVLGVVAAIIASAIFMSLRDRRTP